MRPRWTRTISDNPGLHVGVVRLAARLAAVSFAIGTVFAAEDTLIVITPHWEGIKREYERAFSDWHKRHYGTPVTVDWRDVGGTSDLVRYVDSRFAANPNGGDLDIAWGGGMDPYFELQKKRRLIRHDPPAKTLARIPAEAGGVPMFDPAHEWFGTAISTFGICANKRVIERMKLPPVQRWSDLCRPELLGWVGGGDLRKTGSIHMSFELILQAYGWERGWQTITRMCANTRNFHSTAPTTVKEASLGNVAYAMAIDFYALMQVGREGAENMAYLQPPEVIAFNPDCVGIFRGAPHRQIAERFVDYLLSDEGQSLWMIPRGQPGGARNFNIERMCIVPALYQKLRGVTLVPVNPFELPVAFRYDPKKGGDRWQIVNDLFGACIIDVHRELVAAWRATIARGRCDDPVAIAELASLPLNEDEVMKLSAGKWKDPLMRTRKSIEWQVWARDKFRRIAATTTK
ncbi:MAG: ABC transporter substrate-binding protein [Verrucomicrobia bacterium]|nr:ABC transporter substrate-binding protein [Verrucomicrobiota bacterium]